MQLVSPNMLNDSSAEEWQARVDLAAAHRLAFNQGFSEGIFNHLTYTVPGRTDAAESHTASGGLRVRTSPCMVGKSQRSSRRVSRAVATTMFSMLSWNDRQANVGASSV